MYVKFGLRTLSDFSCVSAKAIEVYQVIDTCYANCSRPILAQSQSAFMHGEFKDIEVYKFTVQDKEQAEKKCGEYLSMAAIMKEEMMDREQQGNGVITNPSSSEMPSDEPNGSVMLQAGLSSSIWTDISRINKKKKPLKM
ncbi:hypothetical protein EON65_56870 [archaeon]|nr:MAG: hypothetical protein EON65_56870 [archaeon]